MAGKDPHEEVLRRQGPKVDNWQRWGCRALAAVSTALTLLLLIVASRKGTVHMISQCNGARQGLICVINAIHCLGHIFLHRSAVTFSCLYGRLAEGISHFSNVSLDQSISLCRCSSGWDTGRDS